MRPDEKAKGFTLVEAMIVVAIIGVLGALIAQLTLTGFRGWAHNLTSFQLKQKVKNSRDLIINDLRYARSHTVTIGRINTSEPMYSMVSFVDVTKNARSYYRENGSLIGTFRARGTTITAVSEIIHSDLSRFHVIFPNSKDYTQIEIHLGVSRMPYADANRPIEIDLNGSVKLQNQ